MNHTITYIGETSPCLVEEPFAILCPAAKIELPIADYDFSSFLVNDEIADPTQDDFVFILKESNIKRHEFICRYQNRFFYAYWPTHSYLYDPGYFFCPYVPIRQYGEWWIEGPADAMLQEAKEKGLIK